MLTIRIPLTCTRILESGRRNTTELKGGIHGNDSFDLGLAAFRFDAAGRAATLKPPFPGWHVGLFGALLGEMSARNEYSIFIDDTKRQRILHGLFDNYYADSPAQVIFDTNRGWCAWMPAIARLFPDAKVIACVRELPWVIDSIERLVQRNVFSPSSIFNYSAGGTVYTRANGVASADGMVGAPYHALKQACYGEQKDRLLLIQYAGHTPRSSGSRSRRLPQQRHRRGAGRRRCGRQRRNAVNVTGASAARSTPWLLVSGPAGRTQTVLSNLRELTSRQPSVTVNMTSKTIASGCRQKD